MRRVLDAFESTFENDVERGGDTAALPDWRDALIRAQQKVIDFYREVLATHDLPQTERASIESRIARIESELAGLQEAPDRFRRPAIPKQQAA
jgi:hypothetical protein